MEYSIRFRLFRKETGSRSPIKVVLKILIISITIACLATATVVAVRLNASASRKPDGKIIKREQRCWNSLI